MKKIFVIAVLLYLFCANETYAQEKRLASASLSLPTTEKIVDQNSRIMAVQNVFKRYNSPLVNEAGTFVKAADEFGVDWRLLPSISGLESTFGKFLMPNSYNAYGWGGGYIYFKSWEQGIKTINKAIRKNYMEKWNAKNVWEIGPIYAESPTWSVRVNSFMQQIEKEYQQILATTPTI